MSNKALYTISGISAIFGTLLLLVANLGGMFMETASGLGSMIPEESLGALVETPGPVLLSGWLNIYGALFIAIAVIGIYRFMQNAGWQMLAPVIVMEFGLVILTISYLVMLGGVYHLAPLFEQGASLEALYGAEYLRKIIFEVSVVYASWLTLGLSPALFGAFGLKSASIPKWISLVALIGGVVGMFVWLKGYPWQAERTALVFVNLLGFTVWMIGVGIIMLKNRQKSGV